MKRSEMIDKIDDYLISRGFRKSGSTDLAISLLNLVEENGMLPPSGKDEITGQYYTSRWDKE